MGGQILGTRGKGKQGGDKHWGRGGRAKPGGARIPTYGTRDRIGLPHPSFFYVLSASGSVSIRGGQIWGTRVGVEAGGARIPTCV